SGMALGDVTDAPATPILGELASPKDNKPYVAHQAGDGMEILNAITATDRTRHNNGAVFAFADGHTEWVASKKITGLFFLPAINTTTAVDYPIPIGALLSEKVPISNGTVPWTAGGMKVDTLYDTLSPYGFNIMMYGHYAANLFFADGKAEGYYGMNTGEIPAALTGGTCPAPSWWKIGTGGSSATIVANNAKGHITWRGSGTNGGNTWLGSTSGYTGSLTIVPNVTAPVMKKVALVVSTQFVGVSPDVTAKITKVTYVSLASASITKEYDPKVSTALTADTRTLGWANAAGFVLPVKPGYKIVLDCEAPNVNYYGISLIFEK
ncbi:MAG TPA: H-X9-DG-CTERM domain-containing protein, partial [Armatimonadota bacterium]